MSETNSILKEIAELTQKHSRLSASPASYSPSLFSDFFKLAELAKQLVSLHSLESPKKDPRDILQLARLRLANSALKHELRKFSPHQADPVEVLFYEPSTSHASEFKELRACIAQLTEAKTELETQYAQAQQQNQQLQAQLKQAQQQIHEAYQSFQQELETYQSLAEQYKADYEALQTEPEKIETEPKSLPIQVTQLSAESKPELTVSTEVQLELVPESSKDSPVSLREHVIELVSTSIVDIEGPSFSDIENELSVHRDIHVTSLKVEKPPLNFSTVERIYLQASSQAETVDTASQTEHGVSEDVASLTEHAASQTEDRVSQTEDTASQTEQQAYDADIPIQSGKPHLNTEFSGLIELQPRLSRRALGLETVHAVGILSIPPPELQISLLGGCSIFGCQVLLVEEPQQEVSVASTPHELSLQSFLSLSQSSPRYSTEVFQQAALQPIEKLGGFSSTTTVEAFAELRPVAVESIPAIHIRRSPLSIKHLRTINVEPQVVQFSDYDDSRSEVSSPESRRPRRRQAQRKPAIEEYFTLTVQALKLNMPNRDKLPAISPDQLFLEAQTEGVPFNAWHEWASNKLHSLIK